MISSAMRCGIVAFLMLTILWGWSGNAPGAYAQNPPSVTLDEVVQAWQARQDRVRTARFDWTELRTTAASQMVVFPRPGREPVKQPPDRRDTTNEIAVDFRLDGEMMRYSTDGPKYNPSYGKFVSRAYVSVFDGKTGKSFYADDDAGEDDEIHPRGFVNRAERNFDSDNIHLWAVLITYRAFHPDLGRFVPADYAVSSKRGVVDSRPCVILEPLGEPVSAVSFWVDPESDFAVRRITRKHDGNPTFQLDVSYKQDERYGWVPSGWKGITLSGRSGEMRMQFIAKVAKAEVNVEIPRKEFQFEFPSETWVVDQPNDKQFIVRPDAGERIITKEERLAGVPYERLLRTESGLGAGEEPSGRSSVLWVCLLGGPLVVLVVYFVGRRFTSGVR